jgi:hypothetical protein
MLARYIPAWMSFSEARDLLPEDDLLAALYDGVIASRYEHGEAIDRMGWNPPVVLIDDEPLVGADAGGRIQLRRVDVEKLAKNLARKATSAVSPARRRGRPPNKRAKVEAEMKKELAAGAQAFETLRTMKEEAMAAKYGVGRDTARKARDSVLSEIQAET